jgi:phage major head subunit gpT-like protein
MIIRAQFPDLLLVDMLPAIDEIIHNKFMQRAPQYKEFFRIRKSTREMEQTTGFSGLGNLVKVAEGKPTVYDEPVPGFRKTYIHDQYSLGFRASRVLADDNRQGLIGKMSAALGRSARETRELHHAGFINANPVGPDGVPLFATNHPIYKAGGVQSNRLGVTSDLDVVSVQLGLTALRKWKSPEGHLVRLKPHKLVVPSALEFRAAEILSGTMRSDTANNTVNAFRHRDGESPFNTYRVWDYLVDPLKWYIWCELDEVDLKSYSREEPNTVHDIDFDTRSLKTAIWTRYCYGADGGTGLFGGF